VVESPGVVKVVPEADAKQHWGLTLDKKLSVSGDRIVTQVYPLKNESAAQLVPILRPLVTPNNSIAAYPGSNVLVITDYADNIRRINAILANIDQPADAQIVTIKLQTASAIEVAQTIGRLMPEVSTPGVMAQGMVASEGVRKTALIADARANTLIARGDNPAVLAQVKKLAESLDRQEVVGGNIRVVYLKNASAVKLAPVLKAILSGQDVPQQTSAATPSAPFTAPGTPNPAANAAPQVVGGTVSPGVAIQADPTTNALIITAPDHVYNNLRAVIDKLDARRAQVYVEAMIAEVSVNKAGEFGVQWLVGGQKGDVSGIGASNLGGSVDGGTGIVDVATSLAAGGTTKPVLPNGFSIGLLNGILGKNSSKPPNLGVLASAIETSGAGNVLSTPNVLTLDNEEAKMIVGQNVPFITGQQSSTGNNPNPFTTVERKDIGIQLKVKPQVSEGGSITLDVYQEVSSVDTSSGINTGNAGLITKKRSIESKVLVDDGQVIVIGGLIENSLSQGEGKVPLLGDLPLIGNLFRYEKRSNKRTNLMVFLRPVILRDGESAQALTGERYQLLRDQQVNFRLERHLLLPDLPSPSLPIIDARKADRPAADAQAPAEPVRPEAKP
jgi:general secretion pathway protein D